MPHAKLEVLPPWDEFRLLEESWNGTRFEIEEMISVAEQHQHERNAEVTYSAPGIRSMVR
jgi:hypothetical protein